MTQLSQKIIRDKLELPLLADELGKVAEDSIDSVFQHKKEGGTSCYSIRQYLLPNA